MDTVFPLPPDLYESSLWVEANDARVGLSEIRVTPDYCYVPEHIYEDSWLEQSLLEQEGRYIKYPRSAFHLIQNCRTESYYACVWYPEVVKSGIPTAPSRLLTFHGQADIQTHLQAHLSDYPFVRLCNKSPKDIVEMPLFKDPEDALLALTRSERTNTFPCQHLFLRQARNHQWEVRCFWSRDKLRAVSLPHEFDTSEKQLILDFFDKWRYDIPYHSATVDLGLTNENQLELIEFNSFGPDMNATAGNFSWHEDVLLLLDSPRPVFRAVQ